jgi:hypothetical protein
MQNDLTRASQEIVDRVIELCRHAESTGADPFAVDVNDLLEKLKLLLTGWKTTAQLARDAEAIYMIATVIKLQEAVVRYKSSLLYTDPLLVELKILASQPGDLARSFLRAWRPLVALQQVNLEQLRLAYGYWSNLRKMQMDEYDGSRIPMRLDLEELRSKGVLADEVQSKLLEGMHEELLRRATAGRMDYWEFVSMGDFTSTVRRAVLVSFLVTLGYAELEIEPLENRIWLRPKALPEIPETAEKKSLVVSLRSQEARMP